MAEHVCPWWMGYFLASPIRGWLMEKPEELLADYVKAGMTVLEPGPGMGFFTLPLAKMVGPRGRVIAVDIQPKMLEALQRRSRKAGFQDRVETRLVQPDRMDLDDLNGKVDLVLAFAVVHETPSAADFFSRMAASLKPGRCLFFAEPKGHVNEGDFEHELEAARAAGLEPVDHPKVRRSHAIVLRKS